MYYLDIFSYMINYINMEYFSYKKFEEVVTFVEEGTGCKWASKELTDLIF